MLYIAYHCISGSECLKKVYSLDRTIIMSPYQLLTAIKHNLYDLSKLCHPRETVPVNDMNLESVYVSNVSESISCAFYHYLWVKCYCALGLL